MMGVVVRGIQRQGVCERERERERERESEGRTREICGICTEVDVLRERGGEGEEKKLLRVSGSSELGCQVVFDTNEKRNHRASSEEVAVVTDGSSSMG